MKKNTLIILALSLCIFLNPQKAHAKEFFKIVVYIENSEYLYYLDIDTSTIDIKLIHENTYIPITCINNEASTLNSVDFTVAYGSLVHSINDFLNEDIPYYLSINLEKVLKDLGLDPTQYEYDTLHKLTKTLHAIKNKFKVKLFMNHKKYIDTNLSLENIYELYKMYCEDNPKIQYYTLPYVIYEDAYIPLEKQFYLKQ